MVAQPTSTRRMFTPAVCSALSSSVISVAETLDQSECTCAPRYSGRAAAAAGPTAKRATTQANISANRGTRGASARPARLVRARGNMGRPRSVFATTLLCSASFGSPADLGRRPRGFASQPCGGFAFSGDGALGRLAWLIQHRPHGIDCDRPGAFWTDGRLHPSRPTRPVR